MSSFIFVFLVFVYCLDYLILSSNHTVHTNIPISINFIQNEIVFCRVDWDDGTYSFSTGNELIHRYSTSGLKKIRVSFSENNQSFLEPILMFLNVFPRKMSCFSYETHSIYESDQRILKFRVSDPSGRIPNIDLSRTFYNMGHKPQVSLFNDSIMLKKLPLEFDVSTSEWSFAIPALFFKGFSQLLAEIVPDSMAFFNCSVESKLALMPKKITTSRNYTMSSIFQSSKLIQCSCSKNRMIFLIPQATRSQVVISFDQMLTSVVFSTLDICTSAQISDCDNWSVNDAIFLPENQILIHSSSGLLLFSEYFDFLKNIQSPRTPLSFGPFKCFDRIITMYSTSTIYYATIKDYHKEQAWSSATTKQGYSIVAAYFDFEMLNPYFIVKNTTNYAVHSPLGTMFEFMSDVEINGIYSSEGDVFVYAYGSHLYSSRKTANGTYSWNLLYKIPEWVLPQTIVSAASSSLYNQVCFVTSRGNLIYLRETSSSVHFLPAIRSLSRNPPKSFCFFSAIGSLWWFTFKVEGGKVIPMKFSIPAICLLETNGLFDSQASDLSLSYVQYTTYTSLFFGLNSQGNQKRAFSPGDQGLQTSGTLSTVVLESSGLQSVVDRINLTNLPSFNQTFYVTPISNYSFPGFVPVRISCDGQFNASILGLSLIVNDSYTLFFSTIENTTSVFGTLFCLIFLRNPLFPVTITHGQIADLRSRELYPLPFDFSAQISNLSTITFSRQIDQVFLNLKDCYAHFTTPLGNHYAQVLEVSSPTSLLVKFSNFTSDLRNFNASNLIFYKAGYVEPNVLRPFRSWGFKPAPCSISSFVFNKPFSTFYISSDELFVLNGTITWKKPYMQGKLDYFFSQAHNFRIKSKNQTKLSHDETIESISLIIDNIHDSEEDFSTIFYQTTEFSNYCNFGISPKRILSGCSPSFKIMYNISQNAKFYSLPINYRPPSYLGKNIPNSPNMYNVDPVAPRIKNQNEVSQKTGEFKSCMGCNNRTCCSCDEKTSSFHVEDSDCMNRAISLYFQDIWAPSFISTSDNVNYAVVNSTLKVTELNNRTDWCLTIPGSNCVPDGSNSSKFNHGDAFWWVGTELYHFKFDLAIGSYCVVSAQIPIFIISGPADSSSQLSAMTTTAFVICFSLLFIYIWYSQRKM